MPSGARDAESPPRIAVLGLMYETNTFAPGLSGRSRFLGEALATGETVLTAGNGIDSISGAVAAAAGAGVEIIPVLSTSGLSGPTVNQPVFEELLETIRAAIRPLRGAIDGLYLQAHGAMVAEFETDVEGALLEVLEHELGVPISVSLDLHAHLTDRMCRVTPLLTGYHTLPHVDMPETGARAMKLLLAQLKGARPVLAAVKLPMITPSEDQDTNREPMQPVFAELTRLRELPGVLDASLFMTQPWLDVPELGWSALVITDDNESLASELALDIAARCWERRDRISAHKVPAVEAVQSALARVNAGADRPVVIADGSDSVSAGSSGDGNELLRALLELPDDSRAQAIVTDSAGAAAAHEAGVGTTMCVPIGGTLTPEFNTPVMIEAKVASLHDGRYQSVYPPAPADVGPTAVLVARNGTNIVVTTTPASQLDTELYRAVGLPPERAGIVITKSAGGYRDVYAPLAETCIDAATSGPADSRLELLPFALRSTPIWPLDRDAEWIPSARVYQNETAPCTNPVTGANA